MITLKRALEDNIPVEVYIRKNFPIRHKDWNFIGRRFKIFYNENNIAEVYWMTTDRCWHLTDPYTNYKSKDRNSVVLYAVMEYLNNGDL